MLRLARHLSTLVSAASLVLCVVASGLWGWSYARFEACEKHSSTGDYKFASYRGSMVISAAEAIAVDGIVNDGWHGVKRARDDDKPWDGGEELTSLDFRARS